MLVNLDKADICHGYSSREIFGLLDCCRFQTFPFTTCSIF